MSMKRTCERLETKLARIDSKFERKDYKFEGINIELKRVDVELKNLQKTLLKNDARLSASNDFIIAQLSTITTALTS